MKELLLQWAPFVALVQGCNCEKTPQRRRIGGSECCSFVSIRKLGAQRAVISDGINQLGTQVRIRSESNRVKLNGRQESEASKSFRVCQIETNRQAPSSSIDHVLFSEFVFTNPLLPSRGQFASRSITQVERGTPTAITRGAESFAIGRFRSNRKKSFFLLQQGRSAIYNHKAIEDKKRVGVTPKYLRSSRQYVSYLSQEPSLCNPRVQFRFLFTQSHIDLLQWRSQCSFLKGKRIITYSVAELGSGSSFLNYRASVREASLGLAFIEIGNSRTKATKKCRGLIRFRVNAEGGDQKISWWYSFLFDPIKSEDLGLGSGNGGDNGAGGDLDAPDLNDDSASWPQDNYDEFDDGETVDDDNDEDWCEDDIDRMLDDDARFEAWKRRTDALSELREYQKLGRDPDNTDWEDWLDGSWGDKGSDSGVKDSGWYSSQSDWEKGELPRSAPKMPERGMNRTIKELFFRIFEREEEVLDDLAFEDRVFRYTSQSTAKFVAVLILVPWLVAFISHDYVILPFLNRYVETVPLAAELLDLRESQKLKMIETLKLERQRVRFEAAIGKAPPLSNDELVEHIHHEALELRDELRLENRKAFGNIWSDILAGLTIFLLLVFNPERVAIMKLTGNRLFTNISDTGKAFIIILLSDIFLGYHSELGWETVIELFLSHYGFEADQASIYIFVAIVPVTIDACFKLWVFRFFTRLSPSAAATFREMKRH